MRYWPLSVVASSPLLPPMYVIEVQQLVYRPPSEGAFYACVDVARQMRPLDTPNLSFIESTDAAPAMIYMGYPAWEEWKRLELGAVVEGDGGMSYIIIGRMH